MEQPLTGTMSTFAVISQHQFAVALTVVVIVAFLASLWFVLAMCGPILSTKPGHRLKLHQRQNASIAALAFGGIGLFWLIAFLA